MKRFFGFCLLILAVFVGLSGFVVVVDAGTDLYFGDRTEIFGMEIPQGISNLRGAESLPIIIAAGILVSLVTFGIAYVGTYLINLSDKEKGDSTECAWGGHKFH